LKEGIEIELRRESGSRFQSLQTEIWNAREPVIVLYRGSANRRVAYLMIADNEEGCKEFEDHADR